MLPFLMASIMNRGKVFVHLANKLHVAIKVHLAIEVHLAIKVLPENITATHSAVSLNNQPASPTTHQKPENTENKKTHIIITIHQNKLTKHYKNKLTTTQQATPALANTLTRQQTVLTNAKHSNKHHSNTSRSQAQEPACFTNNTPET